MKYLLLIGSLVQLISLFNVLGESACGSDNTWTAFQDTTCFKLFDRLVNREEANAICAEEDEPENPSYRSNLMIKSRHEQEFLTNFIFSQSGVVDNVWLGASWKFDNVFEWDDGSIVSYSNWGFHSPSNTSEKQCVQLNSRLSTNENVRTNDGQWSDVSCAKRNLVVCQKLQKWPIHQLQKMFFELRAELIISNEEILETKAKLEITKAALQTTDSNLHNVNSSLEITKSNLETTAASLITLKENPVPIGFIYTQLYDQPTPSSIWPDLNWSEVSSEYTGQFFRVVGGSAEVFGTVQSESAPRITGAVNANTRGVSEISLPIGSTSNFLFSGGDNSADTPVAIKFTTSEGEVRPLNQAVKLWKRIP